MLKRDGGKQLKMTFLTLEELMPEKHFLRDLERSVDFSFIYDIVEPLYARVGRPSIDPVLLVKMLLLGYLYGIPSERKLEQEVRVNIAFRWFLGIDFDEPVPDHSTISQLRHRKFGGTTLFQDIFDEVVRKCMAAGLVTGKLLLTDSTHILANAAKEKREVIEVPDTPSEYVKKLDREALEAGLLDEPVTYPEKTKTVTKSTTDPESGLMNRPGKPNAFCYLNHQTSDAESGIITDVFVTPGNVNDCTPHASRLETQIDKFGFETEAVCADAGYDNSEVYDAMLKRGIRTYIPKKRKPNNAPSYTEGFEPEAFIYDPQEDAYICPQGKTLAYSCYNKNGHKKRYQATRQDCNNCPCRQQCVGSSKNSRMVERLLHEEARQEQAKNRNTPEYFAALRLRKIWCEGNFSHQKAEHNLRRTYKRGIERVTEQCLLSACAMNLIRLVKAANAVFFHCFLAIFKRYSAFSGYLSTAPKHDIPGNWSNYSGDFPLWRLSFEIIKFFRQKFETEMEWSFQRLFLMDKDSELPWLSYRQFSNLVGNLTDMIVEEQNWQPMIDEIWNNRQVADYTGKNIQKRDFMRSWNHSRTAEHISLRDMLENGAIATLSRL